MAFMTIIIKLRSGVYFQVLKATFTWIYRLIGSMLIKNRSKLTKMYLSPLRTYGHVSQIVTIWWPYQRRVD